MLELDGYTELERIGHGGLGDVYRARRTSTGGIVAIKLLRDVTDASLAWNRTRRELTALVSLGGHANVVQLLELLDDRPGLVMEYAPGGSVAQLLERRGATLSVGEVVLIGRHTASALNAAHARGIVHRDVKPQNLLIDSYGQVKLCDFGIAALTRSKEFRTRTSAISMRYASPEDLEEDAEVGPPADVYSLGATLLHLAHGAPPTLKERLVPWVAPPTDDPELAALDGVLAACLRPDPASRPPVDEVLDRLERIDWTLAERCRALDVSDSTVPATTSADTDVDAPAPTDASALAAAVGEADLVAPRAAPSEPGIDADDTMLRTGRRRPEPPVRPAPRSRRRWWPLLLAVSALAAVVVWLVRDPAPATAPDTPNVATATTTPGPTTAPVTDEPPASAPATPTESVGVRVVARPDGLVAIDDASVVWPFGEPGECLVQRPDEPALQVVGCDEAHDLERAGSGVIDADDGTAFDAAAVAAAVDAGCDEIVTAFVDGALPADVRIAQTRPSEESWAQGDRAYQCLLGVPDRRLIGTLAAD